MIDLYNLNPLTANAKIAGINNMFCKNNDEKMNINPFVISKEETLMLMNIKIIFA